MKNRPTQWLREQRQKLAEQGLLTRFEALLKKFLRGGLRPLVRLLDRHPAARQGVIRVIDRIGLRHWIRSIQEPSTARRKIVLDERGQQILGDLKHALTKIEEF